MNDFTHVLTEKFKHRLYDPTLDKECNSAAVLVLFVFENNEWNILYTRRTNEVRTHQGEVSFPGGAREKNDNSVIDTALRETYEEIGISPKSITILGGLERYLTITNYCVYPIIGKLDAPYFVNINKNEVESVFLIPVSWLEDENHIYFKKHRLNGVATSNVVHYEEYCGEHLWGFTARITQQVLSQLKS
ncbi:MAG: CoA pyrophosphatase [Chloroflexi bacterium]|nr:CoA pyrophosphatase [Chloroflexota bacterium]